MNSKSLGTVSIGVRTPFIHPNDDICQIITDSLFKAADESGIKFDNKDVICITESVVARAFNNYVSVDDIAQEVISKYGEDATVGVLYPIFSRNRFSMILKGIARGAKHVVIQLQHFKDEVGNDVFNKWTGVDIISFYRDIVEKEGAEVSILQSNNIYDILNLCDGNVIVATLHDYMQDVSNIMNVIHSKYPAKRIYSLADFCSVKTGKHGYCEFGLLGSNKATETTLKLFPQYGQCMQVCEYIQNQIYYHRGAKVEVLIYGDGCFKDPQTGIWEFADPVTSPGYTYGLDGKPNEVKLKYLIDTINDETNIENEIKNKKDNLVGDMISQGTTPRRYVDLLASLADLTSGSGDKGTPVVWVKNYFKKYTD